MLERLISLLILLHLKPTNGWGRTTVIWKENTIVMIYKEEEIKPETIN